MSSPKEKSTSASRMKKMRERLKLENPDFQHEENLRFKKLRSKRKEKMSEKEKTRLRKYERDRKRIQREKKAMTATEGSTSKTFKNPYKSPNTYGKAIRKTLRSLPDSPRKQKAVVTGLANRLQIDLTNKMERDLQDRDKNLNLKKLVVSFFYRPDIVYTCPGMKDSMAIWEDGKKSTLQKHYLTMFLKEAFSIFKVENPNCSLGFSHFCSLRPKNVLLLKDTPADQCKCVTHENFFMLLKGLKIEYTTDFFDKLLCDNSQNSPCWQNICEKCKNGQNLTPPSDFSENITWKQWSKNSEGKLKIIFEEGQVGELFEKLVSSLPKVLKHVNLKRIQAKAFEDDKSKNIRILQIDFAMSFSCEYQNEVQSALWSRNSVLLFTAATFLNGKCTTYLICSDTPNKDKNTIFCFLIKLYDIIMESETSTEEILWSDGPFSEFKNKYMVKVLEILSEKYKKTFTWKYFATSHGKGVIDGVGGNVKRLVRQKIMSKGEGIVVQNAKDFADLAKKLVPTTNVCNITETEIQEIIEKMAPWDQVVPVPGISQYHEISCNQKGEKYMKFNAISEKIEGNSKIACESQFGEGDWVLVLYENEKYPGEIIKIHDANSIEVSVMIKTSGGHYKWPKHPDSICYTPENIVHKISPPEVVNSRGFFKFDLTKNNVNIP